MIALGNYDSNVTTGALDDYAKLVQALTVVGPGQWDHNLRGEGGWSNFQPLGADNEMSVAELQQFLKDARFFPYGKIDGICGYRTTSAIRLFQEYVRAVEGNTQIGYPDGMFGKISVEHVRRWQKNNQKADWAGFSATNASPEYSKWMALLKKVKEHYLADPGDTLKADLRGNLDSPNNAINIHWGGKGISNSASWSAGCQVVAGNRYVNHRDQPIDCSKFAAVTYDQLGTRIGGVYQTKGAYSVLEDLVTALSGAVSNDNVVLYMLLTEQDLKLEPSIGEGGAREILARLK